MPFAIMALDKPGSVQVRADHRPAHLEHLDRFAAKLLAGGAACWQRRRYPRSAA